MGIFLIELSLLFLCYFLRTNRYAFVLWFPFLATAFILPLTAMINGQHFEPGPGGLTGLDGIPVLILMAMGALALIMGWFVRPVSSYTSATTHPVIVGYGLLLIIIFLCPYFHGSYTLHLRVLDWEHHPVPNVSIQCYLYKNGLDLMNILLPGNVKAIAVTDQEGQASICMNLYQSFNCHVNALYDSARISAYGSVNLGISMPRSLEILSLPDMFPSPTKIDISWNKPDGKDFISNWPTYSPATKDSKIYCLTVFLPRNKGDFGNPYQ